MAIYPATNEASPFTRIATVLGVQPGDHLTFGDGYAAPIPTGDRTAHCTCSCRRSRTGSSTSGDAMLDEITFDHSTIDRVVVQLFPGCEATTATTSRRARCVAQILLATASCRTRRSPGRERDASAWLDRAVPFSVRLRGVDPSSWPHRCRAVYSDRLAFRMFPFAGHRHDRDRAVLGAARRAADVAHAVLNPPGLGGVETFRALSTACRRSIGTPIGRQSRRRRPTRGRQGGCAGGPGDATAPC